MGSGEYGGNGSVHWNIENKHDKQNGHANRKYHGEDAYPAANDKGNFVVQVFEIPEGSWTFTPTGTLGSTTIGTLLVPLAIKFGSTITRQIQITWPDPPPQVALSMKNPGKSLAARGARKKTYRATARKK